LALRNEVKSLTGMVALAALPALSAASVAPENISGSGRPTACWVALARA